jgi:uncharacterized protein (DUF1501 family)
MANVGALAQPIITRAPRWACSARSGPNGGSDYGWSGHQPILGGAVLGGDVYGRFPQIALGGPDDAGTNGRWIPGTSVDHYDATLANWFGVANSDLPSIFPNLTNFTRPTLDFLG